MKKKRFLTQICILQISLGVYSARTQREMRRPPQQKTHTSGKLLANLFFPANLAAIFKVIMARFLLSRRPPPHFFNVIIKKGTKVNSVCKELTKTSSSRGLKHERFATFHFF